MGYALYHRNFGAYDMILRSRGLMVQVAARLGTICTLEMGESFSKLAT